LASGLRPGPLGQKRNVAVLDVVGSEPVAYLVFASGWSARLGDNELVASDSLRPVTLAELVAMRLGAAAGMDRAACSSAYYASLLTWVGCAVDTAEVAALFGDETELYADTRGGDLGGISLAVFVARHLGRGKSSFYRQAPSADAHRAAAN
jgi:hypothetical protein